MPFTEPTAAQHAPLIIDIAGQALNADDRRRLRHPLVGGVVHFARNWHSRDQMLTLNAEIKALRPDLLIAVDHEGGRVQRFRSDGFTHLPAMRKLGQRWARDRGDGLGVLEALRGATECGYVLAAELRACGVDLSFTPVLDLDWGGSSVIGDRALAQDPRTVALLAQALLHGLLQGGLAHCAKHFPGHGHVKADSHTAIPVDRRGLRTLLAADAMPYRQLASSLVAVMPAHVIYPRVDERPAGFSPVWLQQVLRGQLGFQGAIISDDLSMAGARQIAGQALSLTGSVLAALNAGCDLALVCNQSLNGGAALDELLEGMERAIQRNEFSLDALGAARRLHLLPQTAPLPWDRLMTDPRYIRALDFI